ALVLDRDGVGEDEAVLLRARLLIEIGGLDGNTDLRGAVHRTQFYWCTRFSTQKSPHLGALAERSLPPTRTASTSQGAAWRTVSSVRFTRIDKPCRSRLPSTMRSTWRSRATRRISALTLPASTLQVAVGMPSSAA